MHRKSEAELLPLYTEIERTLINLRKATNTEDRSMANQIENCRLFQKKKKRRDNRGLTQWRNSRGPSSKKNTLL